MSDWDAFIDYVPWFLEADADVRVLEPCDGIQLPSSVEAAFPSLAHLLALSKVTSVSVNDISYQLLVWNAVNGQRMGWLCLPPAADITNSIHADHAKLLGSFGGIIERFNEPDGSWLLNHNDALTSREASHDASFINDYMWAFEDAGVALPIRPSDYYSLAREANGNTTLCHRTTGQVLLFAPDNAFDFVVPFEKCPEYTLYCFKDIATLHDWVDAVAQQWLGHTVESSRLSAASPEQPKLLTSLATSFFTALPEIGEGSKVKNLGQEKSEGERPNSGNRAPRYADAMQISVDWSHIRDVNEFYDIVFRQCGSPKWHGRNLDALADAWIAGGINENGPPYAFSFSSLSGAPLDLIKFRDAVLGIAKESITENGGSLETTNEQLGGPKGP